MKYEIIKGSEKDFEGAPDDAIYLLELFSTKAFVSSKMVTLESMECKVTSDDIDNYCIAERRPITEPVWDGEGLPPVGVECEMENDRGTWLPVDVIAHKDGFAFGWSYDYRIVLHSDKTEGFRPIRSPEDVARDEAIDAMRDVGYTLPAAIRFTKEEMASLYDAGYRKME